MDVGAPVTKAGKPRQIRHAGIDPDLEHQRCQLAAVMGLMIKHVGHQDPGRQAPSATVDAALVFEGSSEPSGNERIGPGDDLRVHLRPGRTQVGEIVMDDLTHFQARPLTALEAGHPHEIAEQQVVERSLDGTEERAAVAFPFGIRGVREV